MEYKKGKPKFSLLQEPLKMKNIFQAWWPLAFSYFVISIELAGVTAIVARFESPEINLAAYGSIVYPISVLIEGPIIMMLVASTTLCKDLTSYIKVRRYMFFMGFLLTAIHILVVFTPIFQSDSRWL